MLTQRRTLGITAPLIGNTSFVNPALLDLVTAPDVEGIYSMIDAVIGETRGPASQAYAARFLGRFKMRADPFGSCYYDAAMMLVTFVARVASVGIVHLGRGGYHAAAYHAPAAVGCLQALSNHFPTSRTNSSLCEHRPRCRAGWAMICLA